MHIASERNRHIKAICCIISTIGHSRKGKTMETVKTSVVARVGVRRWEEKQMKYIGVESSKNTLYDTIMMNAFVQTRRLCDARVTLNVNYDSK